MAEYRHPKDIKVVQDFESDSARRDLTINSLGINKDGEIVDYQGGIYDLENKLIRAVGHAKDRYKEDALRLIRTLRFASTLGFTIVPNTLEAVKELVHLVDKISIERVRDEILKTAAMGGNALANLIEHMDETNMLQRILPEVKALQGMKQPKSHHPEGDAYQHTLAGLRVARTDDPISNLSILFHDLGKDKTTLGYKDDDPEYQTYWGHDKRSSELIDQVGKRLKLSNKQIQALKFVAENHMIGYAVREGMTKKRMLELRNDPNWPHLKECLWSDIMSRGLPKEDEFNEIVNILDTTQKELGEKQAFEDKMKALVDGRHIIDLAADIGIRLKDRDIGNVKEQTRKMIMDKKFDISQEEVDNYIKKLVIMLNN